MEGRLYEIGLSRQSKNVFKRNKKPILTNRVSTDNQCKVVPRANRSIALTNVYHVSVRKYHRALRKLLYGIKPKYRTMIAVDETKLKVNGRLVIVYAAIDVVTQEILAIRIMPESSEFQTYSI
ncbi:MAG: hypothetical protein QXN71_03090 [Candidatus Aenigmatarchaeota archaeon]